MEIQELITKLEILDRELLHARGCIDEYGKAAALAKSTYEIEFNKQLLLSTASNAAARGAAAKLATASLLEEKEVQAAIVSGLKAQLRSLENRYEAYRVIALTLQAEVLSNLRDTDETTETDEIILGDTIQEEPFVIWEEQP